MSTTIYITGHHQRSMSHRELSHQTDGIVDAFGFVSASGYPSAYQSTNNIHYSRSGQHQDFQHRQPPEVRVTRSNMKYVISTFFLSFFMHLGACSYSGRMRRSLPITIGV